MTEQAKDNLLLAADMALYGLQTYADKHGYAIDSNQHYKEATKMLVDHSFGDKVLDDPTEWLDVFDLIAEVKREVMAWIGER